MTITLFKIRSGYRGSVWYSAFYYTSVLTLNVGGPTVFACRYWEKRFDFYINGCDFAFFRL